MRSGWVGFGVLGLWLVWGTTACVEQTRCIEGASVLCACEDGSQGAQICTSEGRYGPCRCHTGGDGGAREIAAGQKEMAKLAEVDEAPSANEPKSNDGGNPPEVGRDKQGDKPSSLPEKEESHPENNKETKPEKPPKPSAKPAGLTLFQKLTGLWVGPARQTPLSDFPVMVMDARAASPHVLFSRADLDEKNNLRFAFSIETHGGKDILIYRNGGFFLGVLRDTRTGLVGYDADKQSWRFCAIGRGCSYLEATFRFPSDTQLMLDVRVRGRQHLLWNAQRKETRTSPKPFPATLQSQGTGQAPFPAMPKVRIQVSWTGALSRPADVWVILSTTPCGFTGMGCQASRSIFATAPKGATSVSILLDQVHAGKYFLNTVLDRNQNFKTTIFPDSGDGISFPDTGITIAPKGETKKSVSIAITRP